MPKGTLRIQRRVVKTLGPDWSRGQYEVQDAWYEIDIEDLWTACFRLAVQHGRPVSSEIRIFPKEDRREPGVDYKPGDWSVECDGPEAVVPLGGLTATVLRKVPFEALSAVSEIIEWIRIGHSRDWEWLTPSGLANEDLKQRRPGPKGPTDEELVEYAVEYLDLAKVVQNPHTILERRHDYSVHRSKHLIKTARERSLLSSPVTPGSHGGRAGGSLLPRGEEVLRRLKARKEER